MMNKAKNLSSAIGYCLNCGFVIRRLPHLWRCGRAWLSKSEIFPPIHAIFLTSTRILRLFPQESIHIHQPRLRSPNAIAAMEASDTSYRALFELNKKGQRTIAASVLLVGAGGIGCELLKNLVLTGFKDITIVDLDTIDLSNLNRQFLFGHEHIKQPKANVSNYYARSM